MAEEHGTVAVPASVLVHCPLKKMQLRPAVDCPACKHFGGLEDRFPASTVPFAARFMVRCRAEPVKRQLHALAD